MSPLMIPKTLREKLLPEIHKDHPGVIRMKSVEILMEKRCLLWGYRVIILKTLREKLLQELHKDHPGVIWIKSVARIFMWWPGLE